MTEDQLGETTKEVFLTERELAARQKRSVRTLQNQRISGDGVPFVKFGRSVRYRLCDIVAWEEGSLRNSTSQ